MFDFVFLTETLSEAFTLLKIAMGLSVLDILQIPLKNRKKPDLDISPAIVERTVRRSMIVFCEHLLLSCPLAPGYLEQVRQACLQRCSQALE
jgi:hypothetical protein